MKWEVRMEDETRELKPNVLKMREQCSYSRAELMPWRRDGFLPQVSVCHETQSFEEEVPLAVLSLHHHCAEGSRLSPHLNSPKCRLPRCHQNLPWLFFTTLAVHSSSETSHVPSELRQHPTHPPQACRTRLSVGWHLPRMFFQTPPWGGIILCLC